ncbi:unnamed protein product [Caenorhabditis bovis]|uniref:Uncharacterized protein n=1 Tax=Caenorhabditis bovis TaxID=2654633 RepID=A0A8S1EJS7_9PELO|nr:unnamed protein product [Caenorhabditis bovis]
MEYEEEMQRESKNFLAKSPYEVHRSYLLDQILTALLNPFKKSLSRKFEDKNNDELLIAYCVANFKKSPFSSAQVSGDFHTLPNNVKIYILNHMLYCHCYQKDFVDDTLSPMKMRVKMIGPVSEGENNLVLNSFDNESWTDCYMEVLNGTYYECLADSKESWVAFMEMLNSSDDQNDKLVYRELKNIYKTIPNSLKTLNNAYTAQKADRAIPKRRTNAVKNKSELESLSKHRTAFNSTNGNSSRSRFNEDREKLAAKIPIIDRGIAEACAEKP